MNNNREKTKIIAKNTFALYVRLFVLLVIGLYTSRVTLEILGVTDFGIYNLVGGIVFISNFICNSMALAIDRYLAYNLGLNDKKKAQEVFCMSINIHIGISLLILILAETIGLWFINTQLIIPANRIEAANVIYQTSILSFILFIITIPYNSDVIANEKMDFYALVGIIQGILKLAAAVILPYIAYDQLKTYSLLMTIPSIIYFLSNYFFCKNKFNEAKFVLVWDKRLFTEMLTFAGFSTFGNMATAVVNQGQSILLNLFYGPILNTVRGLSLQVNIALTQFANGIYTAINPQIIKSYAQNDNKYFESLIFRSTKFGYYLLFILSLPIFLEIHPILNIWLKEVPEYTEIFIRLYIINTLIYNFVTPSWMALQATGRVAKIHLITGTINLLNLIVTWILWKIGHYPPFSIVTVNIIISFLMQIATLFIQSKQLDIKISKYCKKVVLPTVFSSVVALAIPTFMYLLFQPGIIRFIVSILSSVISTLCTFYALGIEKQERQFINEIIIRKILKK